MYMHTAYNTCNRRTVQYKEHIYIHRRELYFSCVLQYRVLSLTSGNIRSAAFPANSYVTSTDWLPMPPSRLPSTRSCLEGGGPPWGRTGAEHLRLPRGMRLALSTGILLLWLIATEHRKSHRGKTRHDYTWVRIRSSIFLLGRLILILLKQL